MLCIVGAAPNTPSRKTVHPRCRSALPRTVARCCSSLGRESRSAHQGRCLLLHVFPVAIRALRRFKMKYCLSLTINIKLCDLFVSLCLCSRFVFCRRFSSLRCWSNKSEEHNFCCYNKAEAFYASISLCHVSNSAVNQEIKIRIKVAFKHFKIL